MIGPMLRLARAWGVQTSYHDVDRRRRHAHPDVLLAVLRARGAPVLGPADVPDALREHEEARSRPGIEPVHVAWDGAFPPLRGRLPSHVPMTCRLELEDGELQEWAGTLSECGAANGDPRWRTGLPHTVPLGYHRLDLHARSAVFRTLIISAPRRACTLPERRGWGSFLPLYAVRSGRSGSPDYTDLATLAAWTGSLGGSLFGTLPLLATFLTEPFEPSPYAPASRLFWNDFYIDIDRLPGSRPSPPLDEVRRELAQCGSAEGIDYRRIAALKRRIIDDAAQRFPSEPSRLREAPADHEVARDYARFRAVCDRRREGWHAWPGRVRDGDIRDGDFDPRDERYHLYAARVAERQLAEIAAAAHARVAGPNAAHAAAPTAPGAPTPDRGSPGEGRPAQRTPTEPAPSSAALYLDVPLGVHSDGFDSWRWPELFADGASAGAPPDTFFPAGQNWGFTPLDPGAMRASGYRYFRDCVRHHGRFADALRLDHVMMLERLFWIPDGFRADQGVYVRYPVDEMIAVLTLESVRQRTAIVGEDLGTVSRGIRRAMRRHGLHRMFVLQFEATSDDDVSTVPAVPHTAFASLNTHDMSPFAKYWRDRDTAGRARAKTALSRSLEGLAASRARFVIVNLEDLWLETRPHNVPGTPSEHNWRRRAGLTLEEMRSDPHVRGPLERIAAARQRDREEP